jgi:small multidrug resistance pump
LHLSLRSQWVLCGKQLYSKKSAPYAIKNPFKERGVSVNPWIWLTIAIFFEIAGTVALKLSSGFSRLFPSILTLLFYAICFVALAISLKSIELSIAYAIWAALGTALIALIGIFYFGDSISTMKVISLILVIAGVVGLNLSRTH